MHIFKGLSNDKLKIIVQQIRIIKKSLNFHNIIGRKEINEKLVTTIDGKPRSSSSPKIINLDLRRILILPYEMKRKSFLTFRITSSQRNFSLITHDLIFHAFLHCLYKK